MLINKLENNIHSASTNFQQRPLDVLNKIIFVMKVCALGVIIIMAVVSGYNKHPDEHLHFNAAKYYFNHWLPPPVVDPETIDSYSKYGGHRRLVTIAMMCLLIMCKEK